MYVCICNAITDRQIKAVVTEGCKNYKGVCKKLGVGSCCGRCRGHACEVIQEQIVFLDSKSQKLAQT